MAYPIPFKSLKFEQTYLASFNVKHPFQKKHIAFRKPTPFHLCGIQLLINAGNSLCLAEKKFLILNKKWIL